MNMFLLFDSIVCTCLSCVIVHVLTLIYLVENGMMVENGGGSVVGVGFTGNGGENADEKLFLPLDPCSRSSACMCV